MFNTQTPSTLDGSCYYHVVVSAGNKGTVVFEVMRHFIETLALEDIGAAAKMFPNRPQNLIFTPREVDEYNKYVHV